MSKLLQQAVTLFLRSFSAYYDVETVSDASPLQALCAYHSRSAQYVLSKKAELWAAESHEYLYLFALEQLTPEALEEARLRTVSDGTPRVKPHKEHMSTYLTAVILCHTADPDALAQLKKLKLHREFKLSLHGWMEFRIAAVELSTGEIITNRAGRDFCKSLRPFVNTARKLIQGEEKTQ